MASCFALCTLRIFECAAVRKDHALVVLIELDHLERQSFAKLNAATIFFHQVFRRCEAFYTFFELDYCALVQNFYNFTFMD